MSSKPTTRPSAGAAVNHLVLNVRDLEVSHHFYTEILGFEQCGELDASRPNKMRFYRGQPGHHHDIALMQVRDAASAPAPDEWSMTPRRVGINHIALAYPSREAFLNQLEHLAAHGVEIKVRGNHGMTHSAYIEDPDGYGLEVLYELPVEIWQDDLNGALNYFETMPTSGPESLVDSTDYRQFTAPQTAG